jgi:deazaflavin-dependent oxidoreductase (nitroreductase family)
MPLIGEYQPGTSSWSRKHVEEYEATNGQKAGDLRGHPVVVLTTVGAKTGKLRKTALMRVEHERVYAVVASLGGSPRNPKWYYNLEANPHVELQDGAMKRDYLAHEAFGRGKGVLVGPSGGCVLGLRGVPEEDLPPDSGLRARTDEIARDSSMPRSQFAHNSPPA